MGSGTLFAGFDVGTQGLKGVLVDPRARRVVARASESYGLIPGLPPGAAEQHPDTWLEALANAGRKLFGSEEHVERLGGIGISGQQHGLVVLDERDRPLRAAKLWCDTSTADEARELSRTLGRAVPVGYTASKVLWLARHERDLWKRARRVLLPHDHVDLALSGAAWTEAGDASGTGWFDPRRRAYDAEACAAIDPRLAERLAPLAEPGSLPGRLTASGARLLGLSERQAGTPLATGAGDNMASAIGAGATREGVAVLSLGTSATIACFAPRPVIDPAGAIAPFCDSTGGWLPLLCVMNATGALEEVRSAWQSTHAELEREAARLAADPAGPLCLPFFAGERVPDLPHARAALLGLGPGSLSPARVYRAVLEGVALNLAQGVRRLRALGLECRELRAVGGGARNALWLQLVADACDAVVVPLEEQESAALGAALQAAWSVERARDPAAGLEAATQGWARPRGAPCEPDRRGREVMALLGERFQAAVGRLHGVPPP